MQQSFPQSIENKPLICFWIGLNRLYLAKMARKCRVCCSRFPQPFPQARTSANLSIAAWMLSNLMSFLLMARAYFRAEIAAFQEWSFGLCKRRGCVDF